MARSSRADGSRPVERRRKFIQSAVVKDLLPLASTLNTEGLDIWMGRKAAMLNGRPFFSSAITASYPKVTSA